MGAPLRGPDPGGHTLTAFLALSASAAPQSEDAGAKLLAAIDEAHTKAKTLRCDLEIVTQEAGRSERKLSQTLRVKGQKCLLEFTAPEAMKGTKVLVLGPTEWYVYLPAFGKVRRIASHTKDTTFMGLSFTIDDYFFNTYSEEYSAAAVPDEPAGDVRLLLIPKPGKDLRYAKIDMTVDKQGSVPTLLNHYDEKGTLLKTETRSDYVTKEGVRLATRLKMVDRTREGQWTTLEVKNLEVNADLSDDLFTKRSLGQ